jgi:hypothetical protein
MAAADSLSGRQFKTRQTRRSWLGDDPTQKGSALYTSYARQGGKETQGALTAIEGMGKHYPGQVDFDKAQLWAHHYAQAVKGK